jgi:hypothetical protein
MIHWFLTKLLNNSIICSLHLSVELDPGWEFVETEDWEPDFLAKWATGGGDLGMWMAPSVISYSNISASIFNRRWVGVHQRRMAGPSASTCRGMAKVGHDTATAVGAADIPHYPDLKAFLNLCVIFITITRAQHE